MKKTNGKENTGKKKKRVSPERREELTKRRVRQWQETPTTRRYKIAGENGASKYIPAGVAKNIPAGNR